MKKLFFTAILFFVGPLPLFAGLMPVSLDDILWYGRRGFDISWIRPDYQETDDEWIKKYDGVPIRLNDLAGESTGQIIEYTLVTYFYISKYEKDAAKSPAINFPSIGEAWKVFLNGELIENEYYIDEKGLMWKNKFVRGKVIHFSPGFLREGVNKLVIRIAGHDNLTHSGLQYNSGYEVGESTNLYRKNLFLLVTMFIGVYLFIGIYHLALYFSRIRERYYLYFAVFCFTASCYFFIRSDFIFTIFDDFYFIQKIEYLSLFFLVPLLTAFFEVLFFNRVYLPTKIYTAFCCLMILVLYAIPFRYSLLVLQIWQVSAFLILVYNLRNFFIAMRQRLRVAYHMIIVFIVGSVTFIFDLLDSMIIHSGVSLSKYSFMLVVISIAILLANKFVRVHRELEDLNVHLEKKVEERTEELHGANKKLNIAYEKIKSELKLAKDIQSKILPENFNSFSDLQFYIKYLPLFEIGGDMYDIFQKDEQTIRIFLSDATGHGVTASLITMLIKSEYERVKTAFGDPSVVFNTLNEILVEKYSKLNHYFTGVIMDIDTSRSIISYSSAGHPDQYLLHGNGIETIKRTGRAVGIKSDLNCTTRQLEYRKGDKLVLFTDGLIEEFNIQDDLFGEERILEILKADGHEDIEVVVEKLVASMKLFVEEQELNDDITVIGIM